jgi:uncharacterized protein
MAEWDKLDGGGRVEDRRSSAPVALGGLGLVGVLLVVGLSLLSGGNNPELNQVLQDLSESAQTQNTEQEAVQDGYADFAAKVVGSGNSLWEPIVENSGGSFVEPTLVLFREATQSGCGVATSAVGPHYCPADGTIYLDETFFDELTTRFGARGGDVAEAYVIAHEIGHHIQNITGQLQAGSEEESVSRELQADCYAGVWARSVADQGVLEPGEINEALDAAAAVGDDRIQEKTTGRINPESWTHGSSEARKSAFSRGYDSFDPGVCSF